MPCIEDLIIQVGDTYYPMIALPSFMLAAPGATTSFNFTVQIPQPATVFPQAEEHFLVLKKPTNIALPTVKLLGGVVKEGDVVPAAAPAAEFPGLTHNFNIRCVDYSEWLEEKEVNNYQTPGTVPLTSAIFGLLVDIGCQATGEDVDELDCEVFSDDLIMVSFASQPGQTAKAALDSLAAATACRWYVDNGGFTDITTISTSLIGQSIANVVFVHQDYVSPDPPIAHIKMTSDCILEDDPNGFFSNVKYKFGKIKPTEFIVASNPEVAAHGGAPFDPDIDDFSVAADMPDPPFGPLRQTTIAISLLQVINADNITQFTNLTVSIFDPENPAFTTDAALDLVNRRILLRDPASSYYPTHPVILHVEQTRANYYGSVVDTPLENYIKGKRKAGTGKFKDYFYEPSLSSSTQAQVMANDLLAYARQNRVNFFEFISDRDVSADGIPWRSILQKVRLEITDLGIDVTLPILSVTINPLANPNGVETKSHYFNYIIQCGMLPRLTTASGINEALRIAKGAMTMATNPIAAPMNPMVAGCPYPKICAFAGDRTDVYVDGVDKFDSGIKDVEGLAFNSTDDLYVVDAQLYSIYKINNSDSIINRILGTGSQGGSAMTPDTPASGQEPGNIISIAVSPVNNQPYFIDKDFEQLWRIDGSGDLKLVFDDTGNGILAGSAGIDFDSTGLLYIAVPIENQVFVIDTTAGSPTLDLFAGLGSPGFSGDTGAATAAELNAPADVACDNDDNVIIADKGNNRLRKVDTGGIIDTIFGDGSSDPAGNNVPAASASGRPISVIVDSNNNVIFNSNSSFIRRISAMSGLVTDLAGTGTLGDSGNGGMALSATLDATDLALNSTDDLFVGNFVYESGSPAGASTVRKLCCDTCTCNCPTTTFSAPTLTGDTVHNFDFFDSLTSDSTLANPDDHVGTVEYSLDLTNEALTDHVLTLNYLGQLNGSAPGQPDDQSGSVNGSVKITLTHAGGTITLVDEYRENTPAETDTSFSIEFPGTHSLVPYYGQTITVKAEFETSATRNDADDCAMVSSSVLSLSCI